MSQIDRSNRQFYFLLDCFILEAKEGSLLRFLAWFYRSGWQKLLVAWQSIVLLTLDWFSIGLLIKTLFAPWRRDVVTPVHSSIQELLQAMWFNLIARLIGGLVRSLTILAGLTVMIAELILGAAIFILALTAPISLPVIFVFGLSLLSQPSTWPAGLLFSLASLAGGYLLTTFWLTIGRGDQLSRQGLSAIYFQGLETPTFHGRGGRHSTATWSTLIQYCPSNLQALLKAGELRGADLAKLPEARFILMRGLIDWSALNPIRINQLDQLLGQAATLAVARGSQQIEVGDLIIALAEIEVGFANLLKDRKIDRYRLERLVNWQRNAWRKLTDRPSVFKPETLVFTGGIGKDWHAGYTPTLDEFSIDWSKELATRPSLVPQFLAHRLTIKQIERVLARSSRHNVILLGEPGTGRRTIVLGFAYAIQQGKMLRQLSYKRVVELNLNHLTAIRESGRLEATLVKLLNESVRAGNIILFIDDFDRVLDQADNRAGALNALDILIPYLESPNLQLIAISTFTNFHSIIERSPSLVSLLERVEVREPDLEENIAILMEVALSLEPLMKTFIPLPTIERVVALGSRFMANKKFPLKGVQLLDEASVLALTQKNTSVVLPEHVDQLIEEKTHIPVGRITGQEKQTLLDVEQLFRQRLVNQKEAIQSIADALRRSRAGVSKLTRPIGSFLMLGPTGVGKTETAKTLAEIYYGSENQMVRFDMSEYQAADSINRLIGGQGYEGGGLLTNQIKDKPFALLLFDEIEKAHPAIRNLFLQLLDEGQLTDAFGQAVDFKNTLIIATSNAGAEWIREKLQAPSSKLKPGELKTQLLDYLLKEKIFTPEFLNRFDAVVAYRPLGQEELIQVVELMLKRLNDRLKDQEITIEIEPAAEAKLAQIGFDPQFGARALARAMQSQVENLVAMKILKEQLKRGEKLVITGSMIRSG